MAEVDAGSPPDDQGRRLQVEALWTLAWALSLTPAVNWSAYCKEDLASWLPDLRAGEDPARFRAAAVVRADSAVLDELDAVFCLTWGCAEANLRGLGELGSVSQYVMWERRRALEWLAGGDWDVPDYNT